MRTGLTILLLAGLALSAGPETKPVRNRRAVAAKLVYERAASAAQVAYHNAMKVASDRYAGELDAAMAEATRAGDLEDALAIRAERGFASRTQAPVKVYSARFSNGSLRWYVITDTAVEFAVVSEVYRGARIKTSDGSLAFVFPNGSVESVVRDEDRATIAIYESAVAARSNRPSFRAKARPITGAGE